MPAQSERTWIIGLGVLAAVLMAVLVFVLVSGGDDDTAASTPAVSIESLRATGYDAVLDFSVRGYDDPSSISIDWGDGSSPLALRGAGAMSASYTYPAESTEAVVVVTATAPDGTVLRASRPLVLSAGEPISETSTPETSSPETSTPDESTTTTASTTTTTPTTTTTTERPTIEVELVPGNAAFEQRGNGEGSARLNGRTVSVYARTSGLDGESVRTATLTWTIRASRFEGLTGNYQVRARLEPTWAVGLQASVNSGRAARWFIDFEASSPGHDFGGSEDAYSVESGTDEIIHGDEVFGFGSQIAGEDLGNVVVTLTLTCQAIPGTTIFQIGETSTCDARDSGGFTIDHARIHFVPVD